VRGTGRTTLAPQHDVRAMLGALHGFAGALGVGRVQAVVLRGPVAEVLAAVAARVRARYVCIGRDVVDGAPALRLAERLLARTSAGVIVVPGSATGLPTHLVAAVDGGRETAPVLREAVGVLASVTAAPARQSAARLTVVRRPTGDTGRSGRLVSVAELSGPDRPLAGPALARWTRGATAWLTHHLQGVPTTRGPATLQDASSGSSASGEAVTHAARDDAPVPARAATVDLLLLARSHGARADGARADGRWVPLVGHDAAAADACDGTGALVHRGPEALDLVVRVALAQAACPILVVPRSPDPCAEHRRSTAPAYHRGSPFPRARQTSRWRSAPWRRPLRAPGWRGRSRPRTLRRGRSHAVAAS
jgi:hypothetical protein